MIIVLVHAGIIVSVHEPSLQTIIPTFTNTGHSLMHKLSVSLSVSLITLLKSSPNPLEKIAK